MKSVNFVIFIIETKVFSIGKYLTQQKNLHALHPRLIASYAQQCSNVKKIKYKGVTQQLHFGSSKHHLIKTIEQH